MAYEPIIGLEIHAELSTKTKMFCYSPNDPDETHPNVNICPVCMGHPGTLPVINEDAVKKVILAGYALNGTIAEFSQFDRKNYFYPDLPKGYQISQYQYPLVQGGYFEITNDQNTKQIRIRRIHLEEDTGRLIHDKKSGISLVDFNRAGIPLMELVTEPDFRSGEEVKKFGEELQRILRYLGVSRADMEKGQMRVEVNISLLQHEFSIPNFQFSNEKGLGTKVEIKNINSFKYAADAIEYEIERQTKILEKGEKIIQETRGWDEKKEQTFSQRSKEEAHDYRYFPEPDLPPLVFSKEYIDKIRATVPELPTAKRDRFLNEFGISKSSAEILVRENTLADFYEGVVSELTAHDAFTKEKPKKNLAHYTASVLTGDFLRLLSEHSATPSSARFTKEHIAELILFMAEENISNLAGKKVLEEMFSSGERPKNIIDRLGLWQMSDTADLENIASHIVEENPKAVEDYKKGKETAVQFIVGQVMKETRGKANPKIAGDIVKKLLKQG